MNTVHSVPASVDEYIAGYPPEVQEKLQTIRRIIREAAPQAQETIKYKMPTYTLGGNLIYFAAFKKHISIFPAPAGDEAFNTALAPYVTEKSTVHFPLNQPLPYDLITRIVQFRLQDHLARLAAKKL
jgi:uncharacterized protein YdhG (YjbR/CyaY superfamily)